MAEISMSSRAAGAAAAGTRSSLTVIGAAEWLSLAAAPTFAIMGLLTRVLGGPPDMLCSAAQDTSPLGGMMPMYVLMSVFHAAPWLRLLGRRRPRPS